MKPLRMLPLVLFVACSTEVREVRGPVPAAPNPAPTNDAGTPATNVTDDDDDDATDKEDPLITARPYDTTLPDGYDESKPTPVVMLLHGYMSNAKDQDTYFGLSAFAKKNGFLVALPNGTKSKSGQRFWAATDACCNLEGDDVDDVKYLTAVIADMKRRFNVDPKRVFIAGHSNGGFMAHRMACERSQDIAAIVSLAGGQWLDPTKCKAEAPVAVLQVHGDEDETVSYEGGSFAPGLTYPSAVTTVATWAKLNGCEDTLDATDETLDLESTLEGEETIVARHACDEGAAELWTIAAGKHIPRFQSTWSERIWAFLEAHPKP